MENPGLISVVVPVYKVEEYLDRCVQSIVNQTYTKLEIILVDDGSPDNCPAMCESWAKRDSRIMVVHKHNGGLSEARNVGMKNATGEFLAFVDSDDYLSSDIFEKMIRSMKRDNCDITACTVMMVWENEYKSNLLTVQKNMVLNREEAQQALLRESYLKHPVWYKLYKRDMVCDILFEVGKYHEDVFWSYQALGRASKISLIEDIGYYYTQRSESIMGVGYSLRRLDALEAIVKRYAYIKREFPSLEKEARLSILSKCIYHGQMALKYLHGDEKKQAWRYLQETKREYKIRLSDYNWLNTKRKIWLGMGSISLLLVCKVRNALQIGL